MSTVVIDASALLALLRDESGAAIVQQDVQSALVSTVNLGETAQRLFKVGTSREVFEALIDALELEIVPVDTALALDAAEIRDIAREHGLSQADCICLALAKRMGISAMTADQDWAKIAGAVGVDVRMIR